MGVLSTLMCKLSRLAAPGIFRFLGMDIFGYRRWLDETMNWSDDARTAWRLERLNSILDFCWQDVPFFREFWGDHGVSRAPLRSLEELESYPVLSKNLFKANYDRIRPDTIESIPHKRCSTGGTTGGPVKFCEDLDHHALRYAYGQWAREQAGCVFGDPVAIISGQRLLPDQQKSISRTRLRLLLERVVPLLGVHMDQDLAREYHKRLLDEGVKLLYGYPSILSEFACCLSRDDLKLPDLKAVFTTAEMLQPRYRKNIEEKLGCPVWDEYGCNDGGILAYECHLHDGHHYNDLESVVEVTDKRRDGAGSVLVTNLWNRSTPFVRYENGDVVRLAECPCPCGLPFPLISSLEGRTTDILTLPDGRTLSGPALTLIFCEMDIDGWQIVQTSPNVLEVRVLSASGIGKEDNDYIEKVFAAHVGENVQVKVVTVRKLETTVAGKLKSIWVEFDQDNAAP